MIILSEETIKAGKLINDKRNSNGLTSLTTVAVPLLQENKSNMDCNEENKISSSNNRMRLLGTLLKTPQVIKY